MRVDLVCVVVVSYQENSLTHTVGPAFSLIEHNMCNKRLDIGSKKGVKWGERQ